MPCDPNLGPCSEPIPIDHKTPPVLMPGDHVNDTIAPAGDVDMYSVYLLIGQSYDFDVYGEGNQAGDLLDPTLTFYDPFGTQVAYDDDGGAFDPDAHIDFTAQYSGYYTLAVTGLGSETGDYTLLTNYDDGMV